MTRYAVLEGRVSGSVPVVLWNCEIIRDGEALKTGLAFVDRSYSLAYAELYERGTERKIGSIQMPFELQRQAVGQVVPDAIFKIVLQNN